MNTQDFCFILKQNSHLLREDKTATFFAIIIII